MTKTKTARLIALMRRQRVTPLIALQKVGILSLAQRVSRDISAAWHVDKQWQTTPSGSRVMSYRITGRKT